MLSIASKLNYGAILKVALIGGAFTFVFLAYNAYEDNLQARIKLEEANIQLRTDMDTLIAEMVLLEETRKRLEEISIKLENETFRKIDQLDKEISSLRDVARASSEKEASPELQDTARKIIELNRGGVDE